MMNTRNSNISVEFLFFALNPARGVNCITGGQAQPPDQEFSHFPKALQICRVIALRYC
jgi:hypothetical protein